MNIIENDTVNNYVSVIKGMLSAIHVLMHRDTN